MKTTLCNTTHDEEGNEIFVVTLECGCVIPVPVSLLFEDELPCPLHEEDRWFDPPHDFQI